MFAKEVQKGQILLIVVLVMVTTLTIGLAVAARSITNIRTSEDAASSEKAFSAAEAGIERTLAHPTPITNATFTNNSHYSTSVIQVAGTEFPLNNGSPILKDNTNDIWLSTYPNYTNQWSGNLTIYWGTPSDTCTQNEATNTMAAMEIIVLSGPQTNPVMTRYDEDPCTARRSYNSFDTPSGGGSVAGQTYQFSKSIAVTQGLFVRVVPLYAPALAAVRGTNGAGTPLPAQGTVVQSTGTSGTTEREIITYDYYPKLPGDILQYSFFIQQ
jgi:hypothetical protein